MSVRPIIDLSRETIYFGTLTQGHQSDEQVLTITNKGWTDAIIESITLTGDYLMERDCPEVLKPQQTGRLKLKLTPTSPGMKTGSIHILLAEGTGEHYVVLTGMCLSPYNDEGPTDLAAVPIFLTREALTGNPANLGYPEGTFALVVADPTLTNIGFYKKNGDPFEGNWGDPLSQMDAILPNPFLTLANAILAANQLATQRHDDVTARLNVIEQELGIIEP